MVCSNIFRARALIGPGVRQSRTTPRTSPPSIWYSCRNNDCEFQAKVLDHEDQVVVYVAGGHCASCDTSEHIGLHPLLQEFVSSNQADKTPIDVFNLLCAEYKSAYVEEKKKDQSFPSFALKEDRIATQRQVNSYLRVLRERQGTTQLNSTLDVVSHKEKLLLRFPPGYLPAEWSEAQLRHPTESVCKSLGLSFDETIVLPHPAESDPVMKAIRARDVTCPETTLVVSSLALLRNIVDLKVNLNFR